MVMTAAGRIVTSAVPVVVPSAFVAVSVLVVVTRGVTACVPDAATVPIDWSILTVVASVTVQARVEDSFSLIEAGVAVKESIVGVTSQIVTVAVAVLVPSALVAVSV